MTLVLFIPCEMGAILISDRLNILYNGEKANVDKIIQISNDTIIGFAGNTEHCQHIVDQIKILKNINKGDISHIDICEKIRDVFITLKRESKEEISAEFILVQNFNHQIRIWIITNGIYHELDPNSNYAIGISGSIRPQLDIKLKNLSFDTALQFGIDLIGWASVIETNVGSPSEHGCNVCRIDFNKIELETILSEVNLNRMLYKFDVEQNAEYIAPIHEQTIRIGYISATSSSLEIDVPFLKEIIERDLNDYAHRLGSKINFEIVIKDAKGSTVEHLKIVQELKDIGIKYVIGGLWSSLASASLNYCNENGILLFSPSSTSPLLSIPNDNFFRMCPTDLVQGIALSEILLSYGIKAVVVIQRGDVWADGIFKVFESEYKKKGGMLVERIRYAAEVTEFSSYLQWAENRIKELVTKFGKDHVAIEILSFQEAITMITQAKDYPTIYSLIWFGSDGTSLNNQFIDKAPEHSEKLHIFSPLTTSQRSLKYDKLFERYYQLVKMPLGYYSACIYDIAWVIAKAILEAQSMDTRVVMQIIPQICSDMFGASGWCCLDKNGDRLIGNFDIWGYGRVKDGTLTNINYGFYNGLTGQVTWYTDAMRYIQK